MYAHTYTYIIYTPRTELLCNLMKMRFKKIYDTYTLLLINIENIHHFRYCVLLITLISKYFGHKITYMHKCAKINELRYYAIPHKTHYKS